jgi:hypothetical protein
MAKSCAKSKARVALSLQNGYTGNLTYFSLNEWEKALREVSIGQGIPENLIEAAIERYRYYKGTRNNLVATHI